MPVNNHSTLIILERFIDVIIIGITLWGVLKIYLLPWEAIYTWWLLITILGFRFLTDPYKKNRRSYFNQEIRQIIMAWLGAIIVMVLLGWVVEIIPPSKQPIFIFWCLVTPIILIIWHLITNLLIQKIRKIRDHNKKIAIVGDTRLGRELKSIFQQTDGVNLNYVSFYDDKATDQQQLSGDIAELIKKAKKAEIDIIYITLALKAEFKIQALLAELADTTALVYYVPDLFIFDLLKSNLSYLHGIPVVSVYDTPFYGMDGVLKRIFDILVSLLILFIIAIPLLIITLSVKLSSPGKILFKQRRYGLRGEEIIVWKFRSMTVNEDDEKIQQATKNDSRVTTVGAFLRRNSLDELPQFINVLQGYMSIVGPRPHAVVHNELYRSQIKGYMLRHKVKPGITGLAQISGFRGETDTLDKMEGRVRYDLEYIKNWSLWLDIKIILLTLLKFANSKAY